MSKLDNKDYNIFIYEATKSLNTMAHNGIGVDKFL